MALHLSRSVGFAALVFAIGACSNGPVAPATAIPKDARLAGVSSEGIDFFLRFDVQNPGAAEVSAPGLAAQVTLDGDRKIGTAAISNPFRIPPRGQATSVEIALPVPWDDVKTFLDLSTSGRDIPFQIDGILALDSAVDRQKPFQLKGTVPKAELASAMSAFARSVVR
jgi:hypothetical protein